MFVDPQDVIIRMPPGSAVYGRFYRPEPRTDFLVREDTEIIKSLRNPVVTVRPGVFYGETVAPVVVMVWIGKNPDQLFETWFNYYTPDGLGKQAFEDLSTQSDIAFHFYNAQGKVMSVKINNGLQDFFRKALEGIRKITPWGMRDFDNERDRLYRVYRSPMDLWKKLGEKIQ